MGEKTFRKCCRQCTNVDLWKIKSFLFRARLNGFLSLAALVRKQPIMSPCSTTASREYLDPEHFLNDSLSYIGGGLLLFYFILWQQGSQRAAH